MKKWMMGLALSSAALLTACSGGNEQSAQSAKPQPSVAEKPAAPQESTPAGTAEKAVDAARSAGHAAAEAAHSAGDKVAEMAQAAGDKAAEAAHAVQGAMTPAQVPAQPQPPVDKGAEVYGQCVGCHGPSGEGGVGPRLAGQSADEIKSKLHAYKAGKKTGPTALMMADVAGRMSEADIDAVADYIAKSFK